MNSSHEWEGRHCADINIVPTEVRPYQGRQESGVVLQLAEVISQDDGDDYAGSDDLFLEYEERIETDTSPTMDVAEIIEDVGGNQKKEKLQK